MPSPSLGNLAFPAFRSALNSIIHNLDTCNAGATAPTDFEAFTLWLDTSGASPVLKIRNASNTAWANAVEYLSLNVSATEFDYLDGVTSSIQTQINNRLTQEQALSLFNASGSAPVYACRAWVTFDGSSTTPTINASGNISSISRTGTGLFTVNFSTAMPSANYSIIGSAYRDGSSVGGLFSPELSPSTTSFSIRVGRASTTSLAVANSPLITLAVFA